MDEQKEAARSQSPKQTPLAPPQPLDEKEEPQSNDATAAANAMAAMGFSPDSESDPLARLLDHIDRIVAHLVPRKSESWSADAPGMLLSSMPRMSAYQQPFGVVWLMDHHAAEVRRMDQNLATVLKAVPLLPHLVFKSAGDGDCLPRSILLADAATDRVLADNEMEGNELISQVRSLQRDTHDGSALNTAPAFVNERVGTAKSAAQDESAAIEKLRAGSAAEHHSICADQRRSLRCVSLFLICAVDFLH